ncbi:hypothetical protein [Deinococcus sp. UR1]|uniref:hypothetical protein n=1 Tax=Deinococcus sp. UR1 TaxID=1704277 RepID=UPI0006DC2D2B|nr:hypothetical protein [Deinococcus sp. UR1]PIH00079.1 hypothetical protein AMD26_000370 [Deinococcus sp. UR1]
MSKSFTLPLMAALPALLASCGNDLDRYSRTTYGSYEQCIIANRVLIQQGLRNPCVRHTGSSYYGPYVLIAGGSTRYVGYNNLGKVSGAGLTFDSKRGSYGSFKAPVSRGGFTSSSRSGSFGG